MELIASVLVTSDVVYWTGWSHRSTFQCGGDAVDSEAAVGSRRQRAELLAHGLDVRHGEDHLVAVVAPQEPGLRQGGNIQSET